MDRTSAGLLAGWALLLATPVLGVGNLYVQWQSCRADRQLSNAPADAGSWRVLPRPLSLGCDTIEPDWERVGGSEQRGGPAEAEVVLG